MQSPNQKKLRGISGVVIAVLLAVIGIAAVLMFWGMMSGFFNPQPKVIIEKATITKIGDKYDVSITVRETGGASTTIIEAKIFGPGLNDNGERINISTGNSASSGNTGGSSSGSGTGGSSSGNTGGSNTLVLSPGSSITITGKLANVQLKPGVTYYIAVYYTKGDSTERSDLYPVTVR
jgi:uncharacterized membrane protein YgcG